MRAAAVAEFVGRTALDVTANVIEDVFVHHFFAFAFCVPREFTISWIREGVISVIVIP